jgi:DNA polymerase alpha subunit A
LYDSSRANPHVIVAKDMRRAGLAVKAGDVIPYIVCKSVDFDTKVASGFNEPRMPGDVKDGKAKIGMSYIQFCNHDSKADLFLLPQIWNGT